MPVGLRSADSASRGHMARPNPASTVPVGQHSRSTHSVLLAGNARAAERLIRASETLGSDELRNCQGAEAATLVRLSKLVQPGSGVSFARVRRAERCVSTSAVDGQLPLRLGNEERRAGSRDHCWRSSEEGMRSAAVLAAGRTGKAGVPGLPRVGGLPALAPMARLDIRGGQGRSGDRGWGRRILLGLVVILWFGRAVRIGQVQADQ